MSPSTISEVVQANLPTRKLTEAELRVQRALKKLDIPDWYLNKKSKAPKILKNHTPIDCRLPSWKVGIKPDIMSKTIPLENISDPTGIYKSSMDESLLSKSYNTPRIFENSINETLSEKMSEDQSELESPKSINHQKEIQSSNHKISLSRSDSFPKMSPSRKVENINIVFPETSNSPLPNLPKFNPVCLPVDISFYTNVNLNCTSEPKKFSQTFEDSLGDILSVDDKLKTPKRRNKVKPTSCFKTNLANAISPKPYSKKVSTTLESPAFDSNILANSTSGGTKPLVTSSLNKSTSCLINSTFLGKPKVDLNFSSDATNYNSLTSRTSLKRKPTTIWLGEVKLFGTDCPEICQECGKKPPKIFAAVTALGPNISKNVSTEEYLSRKFKTLMGISKSTGTSASDDEQRERQSVSPPERFRNPNNTSIELPNKNNMNETQNLVQEIIKELSDKCTLKSKNSYYTLPGTKNFVKRLVNDLRGNSMSEVSEIPEVPAVREKHEVVIENSDIDRGSRSSRSSSDLDMNSAALSTSISVSFTNSDSGSECESITSSMKSSDDKSSEKNQSPPEYSPYEDDGVFWIPLKLFDLPRTSSVISRMSKQSGCTTPSISSISDLSDINQADDRIFQKFCEMSESRNEIIKNSLEMEEGGIFDSGYADQSNVKSHRIDSSLSSRSWYENSESSHIKSEKNFLLKSVNNKFHHGQKKEVSMIQLRKQNGLN